MRIFLSLMGVGVTILGGFAFNLLFALFGVAIFIGGIILPKKSKKKQAQEQFAYENIVHGVKK